MNRKYESLEDRLIWNSVIAEDPKQTWNGTPCWIWIGHRTPTGYPRMGMRYKSGKRKGQRYTAAAHRVSIVVFNGKRMTPKMVAKHMCNTPSCINPGHLYGGTQKSNVRQCVKEGRHKTPFRDPDMKVAM